MKETTLILAVICGLGLATSFAQTSSTTTTTRDATTGTTTTDVATTSSTGTIATYTPYSDYIPFRTTTDAAPEVLLHQRHDNPRSRRSDRDVVGRSTGSARDGLLCAGRRSHDRAQDRAQQTDHDPKRDHHNDHD